MTAPMREFDWSYETGMYAGTAAGVRLVRSPRKVRETEVHAPVS